MDKEKLRKAQVPEQLDRLANEISELEARISTLWERLGSVLRSTVTENDKDEDEENLVDVAHIIRSNTSRVVVMEKSVSNIMKALEL
jgi:prefoldin subunit 5